MEIKGQERVPLGVVVERRDVDNRWIEYSWVAAAVIPGAAAADPQGPWTPLSRGAGWEQFHAGTLPLNLFPKETEGYRVNLAQQPPRLFIVLRTGADMESDHEVVPFLVTACPFEAQDYLDSGEEIVEAVTMPPGVAAVIEAFVAKHHEEEVFHKRKRRRWSEQGGGIGRRSSISSGNGNDSNG